MKSDGYSKYVCDKCGKTAYVAAGDTEAREWFTVRRYSAGQEVLAIDENVESVQRIADDVTPDIYELCSQCNTSFMTFMQKDDASFEAWLKEVGQ